MGDVTLLYGVGATKGGTTWLYETLQAQPDCHLRAVKELHYWDSFGPRQQQYQLRELAARVERLTARQERARVEGDAWKVENIDRQLRDIEDLSKVLTGTRDGDKAYLRYLSKGRGGAHLVADITPSYGLLEADRLERMRDLTPGAKFLYLMRDPLSRLWSHVRMMASRRGGRGSLEVRANEILSEIVTEGAEPGITKRGDYAGAVERLQASIPATRLMIGFAEEVRTRAGLETLAAFLGLGKIDADLAHKAHEGKPAVMRPELRAAAMTFLRPQYEFVARELGPLPQSWQDNLARAA